MSISKRAPPSIQTLFDADIARIFYHQVVVLRITQTEFLVHWKGKSVADVVWEKLIELWQFDDRIDDYIKTVSMMDSSSRGGGVLIDP